MNIVPHHHHSCEAASSKIQRFFAEFHVGQILRSCNAYKLRGFAVMAIFLVAFEAAFQRRSFYQRKKDAPESIPFERDTFYRFLNSCAIHWRKFTLLLGTAIIQKAIAPLTSGARRNVLIIDDSLFSRNRSKKVELLARVYDHVSGTYMKGFRMLTLGWSDGNTFLPLSHCLLSSSSKQQQLQGASEDVDPRSNGGKQRKLAQCKAPEVVLTLLQEAREAGAPASTSCSTRGSAHRHRCTRSMNSATTSSRVSRKARRCTSASEAACRTSWPSTGARRSAAGAPLTCSP